MTEIKKVNVREYKTNDGLTIISYTAEWCGPCRRIKPIFLDLIKDITEEVSNEEINKDDYKQNIHPFIPFFVIKKDEVLIDNIQTSSEEELKNFIKIHTDKKIDIDEDF